MLTVTRNANFPLFIPTIIRENKPRVNLPPQKKQLFIHFFVFFSRFAARLFPRVKGRCPLRVQGGARESLPKAPAARRNPNPQQSKTQVLRLPGSRDDVPCGCRAEPANPCRRHPPPGAHPHNKQAERLAPLPSGNPRHEAQSEPIKTNTSAAEAGFSENRPAPNKRRAERRAGPQNCREHAAKNRTGAGAAGPTPPQKRRGKVYFPQKRRNFGKIMQKFPRRGIYNERTNVPRRLKR